MSRLSPSNILHNIEILLVLSYMDLKVKYRGTFLGFFWSFLKPLLQFIVFYTIFGKIVKIAHGPDYALQLFFGVLIWSWFNEATSLGLIAYINKKSIISKIKTNKTFPPLAAFLTPTMNYLLNLCIFFVVYVLFMPGFPANVLSVETVLVFIFSLSALCLVLISCNLILANLNVLYRDILPMWELVLTYGVFLTPIIYHVPVPQKYEWLYYSINLLAFPLMCLKSVLFVNQPVIYQNTLLLSCYLISLSLLVSLAIFTYKKLNNKMVDFL
jgi:ABC-type polysaccharide/polyol phosphate export permease